MKNIEKIKIATTMSIKDALQVINLGAIKIALVVDHDDRLLGTLSDGDIRRGLLNKKTLDDKVDGFYFKSPVVANKNCPENELRRLCSVNRISHIPLLDNDKRVADLFVVNELNNDRRYKNNIVLMAGGLGVRLRPLTEDTPKPMLNVGGRPILHTIVEGLVNKGFFNITMCLGYKADMIRDYFQDGKQFGAHIEYIVEKERMGTAGALTLLDKKFDEPFFVMNGDLITNIDYEKVLDFHNKNNSKATMCVREYDVEVPYGVVSLAGESITSIEEKPVHSFFVNAGIYLLEPECIDLIPNNQFYDMPLLFESMVSSGEKVTSFLLRGYWLDIGKKSDYELANADYNNIF